MATLMIVSEDNSGLVSVNVPEQEASYWIKQIETRVAWVGHVVRCGVGYNHQNKRLPYLGQIVCSEGDFRALMTAREMAREVALI